jgi:general secretion pathway protein I
MSSRTSRFERVLKALHATLRRPAANAGFTLIEVLVAIAVLAVVLGAIGAVVGTTVKGVRSVDRRLPLLETAQNLMATLPDRTALQLGTQSGASGEFRWRIDVVSLAAPARDTKPLNANSSDAKPIAKWTPVAITVRVQGNEGPPVRLDTVRLIPKPAG